MKLGTLVDTVHRYNRLTFGHPDPRKGSTKGTKFYEEFDW